MAAIDAFEIKSLNLASINGSSSTAKVRGSDGHCAANLNC